VRRLLAALALSLLAGAAFAAGPDLPAGGPVEAPKPYYRASKRYMPAPERAVIERTAFNVDHDLGVANDYQLCMVQPGADWMLEARSEALELAFLDLLDKVSLRDERLSGRKEGYWSAPGCAGISRAGAEARYDTLISHSAQLCPWSEPALAGVKTPYAHRKKVSRFWFAVADGIKTLLASPRKKVALAALTQARHYHYAVGAASAHPFAPAVSKLLLDPAADLDVRVKAAATLAALDQTLLTAKSLSSLWKDQRLDRKLRVSALRGYAFVLGYHDAAEHLPLALEPKHVESLKADKAALRALADEGALKDAASCALSVFPKTAL
jgi:hypothetical protein